MVTLRHCPKFASLLLCLFVQSASADLLFTNFDGPLVGGNLYTGGGNCSSSSCFALRDNFSTSVSWNVTGFIFYLVSPFDAVSLANGGRFALFTVAGVHIVSPTNTALTITDTETTYNGWPIYKLEIEGLDVELAPGEYLFGFTNTAVQSIYPIYGSASAQTITPGFVQLTGSPSLEALLSTVVTQRSENWAFQVIGTTDRVHGDGFETP